MFQALRIAVIGDGAWGTTLAILLSKKGYPVTLWGNFPGYLQFLDKKRENVKYLPGIKIPRRIKIEEDIQKAVEEVEIVVLAVPSKYFRRVIQKIKGVKTKGKIFLSVAKGIEDGTLKRMSEVVKEELGRNTSLAVLSGPTIAPEIVRRIPSVAVVASKNFKIVKLLQEVFSTNFFRLYTSDDIIGVELGGALKNIIAIAAGVSDGLGFGANTKAAILSRGLVEIQRLGFKMGAKKRTFHGISGLGDLAVTCISPQSRNRTLGERIGRGEKLKNILKSMKEAKKDIKVRGIPEGVTTVKAVFKLGKIYNVDMPITKEVYFTLYKNKSPRKAVRDLMQRPMKRE